MTDKIIVYTDGSCINNGKKNSIGSIGIFFSDNDSDNLSQIIDNNGCKITNETMELLAIIQAIKIIEKKIMNGTNIKIIYIYTDSMYIINCMTKWYTSWVNSNWKKKNGEDVKNKDLIQTLYNLKNKYITIFKHVRSHQSEPTNKNSDEHKYWYGNFMADQLAQSASSQYVKELKQNQLNNLTSDIITEKLDHINQKKNKKTTQIINQI